MEPKFFICEHCGNVIEKVYDKKVPVVCCGEKMKELKAGTTDAALEKHVPVVTVDGNVLKIAVGSVLHPMTQEHHIAFIYVQTNRGAIRVDLPHDGEPVAEVVLSEGEKAVAVYEYCNLHGLWKTELA